MSDLANEKDSFISQLKASRRQQHASDTLPTTYPSYHSPSLMLSHSGTSALPDTSTASSSAYMSTASSSAYMSTASSSAYMSSALDRSTPQTFTYAYPIAAQQPQPSVAPTPLVCEFIVFGNCDKAFNSGDEAGWITHIAKDHLNYNFPPIGICWFCSRNFRALSHSRTNTEACYRERMRHIAEHLRNGLSGSQIRPDFFLVHHLYEYGLINEDMVHKAHAYHKEPMPSLYPVGWRYEDRDEMPQLMEDNKPSSASGAARSYQRPQPIPAVSDYITRPVIHQSISTRNRGFSFTCDQCTQSFRENRDLKRHERIHLKARAVPSSFPNRSLPQEDDLMGDRLVTGCEPKSESGEKHTDLDHNSTNFLAKDCKPGSDIGTADRLPNSSSIAYNSNNSASLALLSENSTQSQIVKLETAVSEETAETVATPFPRNYSQRHALPILLKLPGDLESRGSSQTPESDGSSYPTENYIDERKSQIIDSIVSNVTQWMRSMFDSCRKNAGGNSAGPSGTPDKSQGSSSKAKTSNPTNLSNQKRKSTESDGGETDDDNEEEQKPDRQSGEKLSQNRENRKYACPYFKYNPTKYKDWRVCPGPGWADIHRVKEHLYRRHRQPKYRCGRCWQPFKDEQYYLNHLRTVEACPLREMEHVEGFDEAQERSLKSRKRHGRELSEDDKWRRVFKILFPHVLDDDIPSPFYEYDQTSQNGDNHKHSESDYLAQCEDYMVREVPQRLRQALGRELDRDLTIVEESLRRKAGDWVKTLLEEAFRELRQNRDGDDQSLPGEESGLLIEGSSILTSQAGSSGNNNLPYEGQSEAWLSNFNLDAFDPFVLLGETEFAFDNGGLLEDLLGPGDVDNGATRKESDSGYGSYNSMLLKK